MAGRKKKALESEAAAPAEAAAAAPPAPAKAAAVKKKRGRPAKPIPAEAPASPKPAASPPAKRGRPAKASPSKAKKPAPKAPVRSAIKKKIEKAAKPKPTKKTKAPKPKVAIPASKYQAWVAEAIQTLGTAEHEYVSFGKIKQYLLDYLDAPVAKIPKLAKQAVLQLVAIKLIKAKKDSFTFTKAGKAKIAPKTVEKRAKVERNEKVAVKKKKPGKEKEEPVKPIVILGTGRVSKPRRSD
jgi:hypothetical protein